MYTLNDIANITNGYNLPFDSHVDRALSSGPNQEQTNGYINANGNYTSEEVYKIQPFGYSEIYHISKLIIYIRANGEFNSTKYGSNTVLTEGISIRLNGDDYPEPHLITFEHITKTLDYGIFTTNLNYSEFVGSSNVADCSFDFCDCGYPLVLRGWENERLEVVLSAENYSDLDKHYFYVQGIKIDRQFSQLES